MTSGLVVEANLHAEAEACGQTLPEALLRRLSAVGTLLRVFARPGDRLWTPRPVDPARLARVDGLPTPELISGEDARPAAEHRRWSWCHADRGLLSRRFQHETAVELGLAHEGSALVEDARALREVVNALAEGGVGYGRWVLKPLWSAAGRGLLHGRGLALEGSGHAPWEDAGVRAHLEQDGGLLVEPWVDRVVDVGCRGWCDEGGAGSLGIHRLLVGERGRFRGVGLGWQGALTADEADELRRVTTRVGVVLWEQGHEGPFSVDAYVYRAPDGGHAFQALGEVNVRTSFGLVASRLARRTAFGGHIGDPWHPDLDEGTAPKGAPGDPSAALGPVLRFGRGAPPDGASPVLFPDPSGDDDTSAWFE